MAYGFHFELPGKLIYYKGCKTEKEAKSELEIFAQSYCRNNNIGFGEVLLIENEERNVLSKYEISFRNKKLVMEELD
tara:strand:+ start:1879 stop:2109 length:231 start_codon:yes stop_codon:yes gene_type:complete